MSKPRFELVDFHLVPGHKGRLVSLAGRLIDKIRPDLDVKLQMNWPGEPPQWTLPEWQDAFVVMLRERLDAAYPRHAD